MTDLMKSALFIETLFQCINQFTGFIHIDVKILRQDLIIPLIEPDGSMNHGRSSFSG
jgi:hypothetical protein